MIEEYFWKNRKDFKFTNCPICDSSELTEHKLKKNEGFLQKKCLCGFLFLIDLKDKDKDTCFIKIKLADFFISFYITGNSYKLYCDNIIIDELNFLLLSFDKTRCFKGTLHLNFKLSKDDVMNLYYRHIKLSSIS